MSVDPGIVVAAIGLVGTVVVAFLNMGKFSKADAVKLEARLTGIETTLENKLEPIWQAVIGELPKLIISPGTPRLDALVKKALGDVGKLTVDEAAELAGELKKRYIDDSSASTEKRIASMFFLNLLKKRMEGEKR